MSIGGQVEIPEPLNWEGGAAARRWKLSHYSATGRGPGVKPHKRLTHPLSSLALPFHAP